MLLILGATLVRWMAQRAEEQQQNPNNILGEVLKEPDVAAWYGAHSAPAVLTGLSEKSAQKWRQYHPAATLDLAKEGLSVRLESTLGPAPRKLEFLVDRRSGKLLAPRPVE